MKPFYVITTIIILSISIISCGASSSGNPIQDVNLSYTKATFGTASSHSPTVGPEGTVNYSIEPYNPAVEGQNPVLPTIDSRGEVSVAATTTAGTYRVSAEVTGGDTYTAPFYVAIFAIDKNQIDAELAGANKGIAMWGKEGDYNYIDTRAVTNMGYLFTENYSIDGVFERSVRSHLAQFNGDISHWDVENVTDMNYMFNYTTAFNQDISSWKVDNVTRMRRMFYTAIAFNQDISSWRVDNVTDMSDMFNDARAFNQDIGPWKVDNVTNMSGMFYSARAFNQDINSWTVSNVIDMRDMFFDSIAFNQDISSWKVDNVTDMSGMFRNASAFNQDISSWKVSNVTSMNWMFSGAIAFNQNLEAWGEHLQGRTVTFTSMFDGSGVTNTPSWYTP